MHNEPLRAGRIIYTNDLPIYAAFDAGTVQFPGVLTADVPARLNASILAGELDMGPVSAFAYLANSEKLALLPDLCIGAREAVWSVLLISSRPPQELGGVEIAVTGESASGFNVLRVLLERRFGVQPTYRVVDDPLAVALAGKPALLIGDTAIEARARIAEHAVYDLGCLWNEWTGCDMVFAVWVARRDVLQARRDDVAAAMTAMCTSYAWGRSHMPEVLARAEAAYSRPPGFYEHYYRTLNFDFDSQAQAGLARFASELENLRAIAPSRARIPEDLACHSLA